MREYIRDQPGGITLEEVPVSDFSAGFSTIDERHLDSAEISQPVILAEIAPGRYNLIDGHHRVEKARRIGIKHIPAYRLNVAQHMRFMTSQRAYVAFVEYWNSKLNEES